jgi:predicted ATPase
MADYLAVKSFHLKNFKAVRDSGEVQFTPLTVFIGNNGSGKSSLIEGLQTYRHIVAHGLDVAMETWRGFEYITNPPVEFLGIVSESRQKINPIEFMLRGKATTGTFRTAMKINMSPNGDEIFIENESLHLRNRKILKRDRDGRIYSAKQELLHDSVLSGISVISATSLISNFLKEGTSSEGRFEAWSTISSILEWQFVTLNPYSMGNPRSQQRTSGDIRLENDGSNIADYLLDIRRRDQDAFDGIIETLQYVLPYASDLQPTLTSELERAVYLRMSEADYKIPGWLLSSGTLRILALLALFRHPKPPPLIVIEEIENGLDPRTIHLIVEELRNLIETGTTQVIITTHSPYLLDLLALSQIVLVERVNGQPTFFRPADQQSLEAWAKDFGPGRLYTMNKLSRRSGS